MSMKCFEFFKYLFKISCFVVVICMISVWVQKYIKDDDLCLVDYKSFSDTIDIELPEVSICFLNMFNEEKLFQLGTNKTAYLKYLTGSDFSGKLANINYNNVTINFEEMYTKTHVQYKDNSVGNKDKKVMIVKSVNDEYFTGILRKCFTINTKELKMNTIKTLIHVFRWDLFRRYIKHSVHRIFVLLHSPHQILLGESRKFILFEDNDSHGVELGLSITKVEILRRRHKPTDRCLTHWRNWDELTFRKQTEDIGCTAPYHELISKFPVCSTAEEMNKWRNMMASINKERDYLPCQGMPRIDFDFTKIRNSSLYNDTDQFILTIGYPEQVKLVTQSRAVDSNTLIGNIGGYIGLFLGNHIDLFDT